MRSSAPVETTPVVTATPGAARAVRVFMMDLLSIVPYYTGHLSEALQRRPGIQLELGVVRYYLDPDCYERMHLHPSPGLDLVSRMNWLPRPVRRLFKTAECLLNLFLLSVRFTVRRPDVLHVQFVPMVLFGLPFEIWFLQLAQRLGIGIVYTVHNVLPHENGNRHRSLYRKLYTLADRFICHDVAAQQRLVEEFGVDPIRISLIPHGPLLAPAQLGSQLVARRRLGIRPDLPLVLWQGILRPYKGVAFLLNAWRQVCDRVPDAQLAIVGTGDDVLLAAVTKQVADLGLSSNVQLTLRFVSVSQLEDYYTAADILVYPYAEATTSGALLTGIGYGKAILATRLPAFEQILRHADNSLLVSYGDTPQLAIELERLIAEPDLRQLLSQRLAQSRRKEPGWDVIAQKTAACYTALLEVPA